MNIARGTINHKIYEDLIAFCKSLFSKNACKRASISSKRELKRQISLYFNGNHSFLVPYARTGLYILLKALDLPPGSRILMSPINIAPMLDIIEACGLVVDFVDINLLDYGPDYNELREKIAKKPKVFFLTYLFGYVPNIDEIVKLCKEYNVSIIEDISQNIGSKYNNDLLGTFGEAAIYSASLTKYVDGYNGGFILTKNNSLAKEIKNHISNLREPNHTRIKSIILKTLIWNIALNHYIFHYLTYNILRIINKLSKKTFDKLLGGSTRKYRDKNIPEFYLEDISEIQSITIKKNLAHLDNLIERRREYYQRALLSIPEKLKRDNLKNSNRFDTFWQLLIKVKNTESSRAILFKNGIETGTTNLPNLGSLYNKNLPNAKRLKEEHIFIPMHDFLKKEDYEKIFEILRNNKQL